jgi:hypothetical protein
MQNYIVHVYRARQGDAGSVAGVIEDTESGHQETFHNFAELQTMLSDFIMKGQLEFTGLIPQEQDTHEDVAVIG